jgi:hypothetical protein
MPDDTADANSFEGLLTYDGAAHLGTRGTQKTESAASL